MKRAATLPRIRCAIYTRKSSEEGLDQAFNSLHAQRDACEAYVLSQAGEGWTVSSELYDDGGFSGGNIERPALKRLLADIDAGQIDIVVVYKIDRLTRSLPDFARIVERLDAAGASFVSVTQAFNTTTSMGRLTLNVLLSFAQFEREVTGERIRDKIAASKAKGLWMGGNLPLGYDAPTDPNVRVLAVNPAEAETVRLIFRSYLELRSVSLLQTWLDEQGIRSKRYVSRSGRQIGGHKFGRGALFHLLRNCTYVGQVPHKDVSYPGQHAAIVDHQTFEAVGALLSTQASERKARPTRVATAFLKGLLFDADGQPMSPSFTRRGGGKIYRYYVSAPLTQGARRGGDDETLRRVRAGEIEALVVARLQTLQAADAGAGWVSLKAPLQRVELYGQEVHLLLDARAAMFRSLPMVERRLAVEERLEREPDGGAFRLIVPVRVQAHGGRTWLSATGAPRPAGRVDATLVGILLRAHRGAAAMGGVKPGGGRDIQAPVNAYERKLVELAFLAPDIQRAILNGDQPRWLNRDRLVVAGLPLAWADQRAVLAGGL